MKARKGNTAKAKGNQTENGLFSDLFKPKVTYRPRATKTALSAAYEAGKKFGDTGEFDIWWGKYRNKQGVDKKKAKASFEAGVEGEPKAESTGGKTLGIRGMYKGCKIYYDAASKEYYGSCDTDSKFDSYAAVKKHVDWLKKGRGENPSKRKNGLFSKSVDEITEGFHGRPVREEVEILEEEYFPDKLAGLGLLVELEVLIAEDIVVPIKFGYSKVEDAVMLTCDVEGNIEFVGGDQDLGEPEDLREKFGLDEVKAKLNLGQVATISYFADKHHLEGPKSQAKGTEYIHTFGEEGGERPLLVYDSRNKKLCLVGGDYSITDEGIRN